MKKKTILLLMPVVLMLLLFLNSCDKRGGVATGVPTYYVEVSASPLTIAMDDSSQISAFVHGISSNDPIGNVQVDFFTLDFGYVTQSALTDAQSATGLATPVYFYPMDSSGTNRIVAKVGSEENYTDSDTVTINVY